MCSRVCVALRDSLSLLTRQSMLLLKLCPRNFWKNSAGLDREVFKLNNVTENDKANPVFWGSEWKLICRTTFVCNNMLMFCPQIGKCDYIVQNCLILGCWNILVTSMLKKEYLGWSSVQNQPTVLAFKQLKIQRNLNYFEVDSELEK